MTDCIKSLVSFFSSLNSVCHIALSLVSLFSSVNTVWSVKKLLTSCTEILSICSQLLTLICQGMCDRLHWVLSVCFHLLTLSDLSRCVWQTAVRRVLSVMFSSNTVWLFKGCVTVCFESLINLFSSVNTIRSVKECVTDCSESLVKVSMHWTDMSLWWHSTSRVSEFLDLYVLSTAQYHLRMNHTFTNFTVS